MSVRKLTNVQAARRVLRERRQRCMRTTASSIAKLSQRASQEWPQTRFMFEPNEVAAAVREAATGTTTDWVGTVSPRRFVVRSRKVPQSTKKDSIIAVKRHDGKGVAVWLVRNEFELLLDMDDARVESLSRFDPPPDRGAIIRPCGPCTERERVAVDTLLERGDKSAERWAIQCERGTGGVLEGPKRRRRRK